MVLLKINASDDETIHIIDITAINNPLNPFHERRNLLGFPVGMQTQRRYSRSFIGRRSERLPSLLQFYRSDFAEEVPSAISDLLYSCMPHLVRGIHREGQNDASM